MPSSSLVRRFQTLFRGLERAHGEYVPLPGPGKNKRARTVHTPPSEDFWHNHLAGNGPFLGIIPITEDDTCYWGAIDVDDYTVDQQALAQNIKERNLPLLVCRSNSGGAHLLCFFIEPVRAIDLVSQLKKWQLALDVVNPDGRSIEIFPKQTTMPSDGVGNWLNLPYHGDKRRCITAEGKELSLEEFLTAAEDQALTRIQLETRKATYDPSDPRFFADDGPPCLASMLKSGEGFSSGSRNSALFNVGVYLRIRWPDDWESMLEDFNQQVLDPPLDEEEIRTIIRSLSRKSYVYTCADAPIVHFCKKRTCQSRRWGIGYFRDKDREEEMPPMGRLTKFDTDPPYYTLLVGGKEVKLPSIRELRAFPRLSDYVCEQTNKQLPILRQPHWHRMLDDLLDELIIVTPPSDAGATGQLLTLTVEFLWMRRTSESREDLLMGKPYQEDDKIYFRSRDLLEYLERKRFRLINAPSDVWSVLRTQGSGSASFTVKGQGVNCWWLPATAVNTVPEEPLTNPVSESTADF